MINLIDLKFVNFDYHLVKPPKHILVEYKIHQYRYQYCFLVLDSKKEQPIYKTVHKAKDFLIKDVGQTSCFFILPKENLSMLYQLQDFRVTSYV